jgi:acyl carrier protein
MTKIEEIKEFLYEEHLKAEFITLSNEDSLLEKGIIDSVKMLDLITFLQEKYDIEIDDEDLYPENFDSLSAINRYIDSKQAA